jgi:hypothetical protein
MSCVPASLNNSAPRRFDFNLLLPGALHAVAKRFLADKKAVWFVGDVIRIDNDEKIILVSRASVPESMALWLLNNQAILVPFSSWFYSPKRGGDFDFRFSENCPTAFDTELFARFVARRFRCALIPQLLSVFRIHGRNITVAQPPRSRISRRDFQPENVGAPCLAPE